jgi:hypothetical protein
VDDRLSKYERRGYEGKQGVLCVRDNQLQIRGTRDKYKRGQWGVKKSEEINHRPVWQQFCAVGVSIWCLSGSVHFLRRNTVDEDPAQCVYQAVDLTAVGQLIWPNKGGESWSGRTIQGSPDRRTPLLDNLLLIPVPPPHHDLAIDRLLRSNSSSLANAVLFSHATKCQLLRSNSSLWWTQCYFLHATKLSIWLITS